MTFCCQLLHVSTEIRAEGIRLALFYKFYTLVRIVYKKKASRYPAKEKITFFRCGYSRVKLLPSKEKLCTCGHCQAYSLEEATQIAEVAVADEGKSNSGYCCQSFLAFSCMSDTLLNVFDYEVLFC